MAQEQIMKLLNRKIKESTKTSEHDTEHQDKMVSLDKACELLKNIIDDDVLVKCGSVIKCMDIDDFVLYFRKSMEK